MTKTTLHDVSKLAPAGANEPEVMHEAASDRTVQQLEHPLLGVLFMAPSLLDHLSAVEIARLTKVSRAMQSAIADPWAELELHAGRYEKLFDVRPPPTCTRESLERAVRLDQPADRQPFRPRASAAAAGESTDIEFSLRGEFRPRGAKKASQQRPKKPKNSIRGAQEPKGLKKQVRLLLRSDTAGANLWIRGWWEHLLRTSRDVAHLRRFSWDETLFWPLEWPEEGPEERSEDPHAPPVSGVDHRALRKLLRGPQIPDPLHAAHDAAERHGFAEADNKSAQRQRMDARPFVYLGIAEWKTLVDVRGGVLEQMVARLVRRMLKPLPADGAAATRGQLGALCGELALCEPPRDGAGYLDGAAGPAGNDGARNQNVAAAGPVMGPSGRLEDDSGLARRVARSVVDWFVREAVEEVDEPVTGFLGPEAVSGISAAGSARAGAAPLPRHGRESMPLREATVKQAPEEGPIAPVKAAGDREAFRAAQASPRPFHGARRLVRVSRARVALLLQLQAGIARRADDARRGAPMSRGGTPGDQIVFLGPFLTTQFLRRAVETVFGEVERRADALVTLAGWMEWVDASEGPGPSAHSDSWGARAEQVRASRHYVVGLYSPVALRMLLVVTYVAEEGTGAGGSGDGGSCHMGLGYAFDVSFSVGGGGSGSGDVRGVSVVAVGRGDVQENEEAGLTRQLQALEQAGKERAAMGIAKRLADSRKDPELTLTGSLSSVMG